MGSKKHSEARPSRSPAPPLLKKSSENEWNQFDWEGKSPYIEVIENGKAIQNTYPRIGGSWRHARATRWFSSSGCASGIVTCVGPGGMSPGIVIRGSNTSFWYYASVREIHVVTNHESRFKPHGNKTTDRLPVGKVDRLNVGDQVKVSVSNDCLEFAVKSEHCKHCRGTGRSGKCTVCSGTGEGKWIEQGYDKIYLRKHVRDWPDDPQVAMAVLLQPYKEGDKLNTARFN